MLTYLLNAWDWVAQSLGLSYNKVQLSRLEEQNAMAKALKLLNLIKSRKFSEALENGTSTVKLLLSASALEQIFNVLQTALGPLISFTPVGVDGYTNKSIAKVLVNFERGKLLAVMAIDASGLIAGFRLKTDSSHDLVLEAAKLR